MMAESPSSGRIPGGARTGLGSGDNGERVRVALTLDCCDREATSWVATTGGINSGDIRDLMIESVEQRFGLTPPAAANRVAVGHRDTLRAVTCVTSSVLRCCFSQYLYT
jgi:transposase InsO family protein